jgi:Membrane proteins related to metalloendopeptidases
MPFRLNKTHLIITLEILLCGFLIISIFKDRSPDSASTANIADEILETTVAGRNADDYSNNDIDNQAAPDHTSDYIKWVDFNVTYEAMQKAFRYDVDTCQEPIHLSWIDLLAYLGAKYGGDFTHYKESDMDTAAGRLLEGTSIEELTEGMTYFAYYREAYDAVLGGMVGLYDIQIPASDAPASAVSGDSADEAQPVWVTKYGLKAFLPVAKNFPYQHYDDFGASRSYGYRRVHLGHDMMGQVGTPVIAVESGIVEAIGWNQYGGWRLGIRSFDGKRYYYYAHLRKNYPYHKSLEAGSVIQAGDVIGYLGRTGYSATENTNNIDEPHLHFGIQLIFDESQKEGTNEIWINCYEIIKFLAVNRSETLKNLETKEYFRLYQMKDPAIPGEVRFQLDTSEPEDATDS